jgi:glucuronate isomerase
MAFILDPDRYFSPEPSQRKAARWLYEGVKDLPLICSHGHVDPQIFTDPTYQFTSPTELLVIPDHYVFRMLYSQGVSLDDLGILSSASRQKMHSVQDLRKAWQIFAENYHLFRGTPTGIWLMDELVNVFGVTEKLTGANAQSIYDRIAEKLSTNEMQPRQLFDQFNIEVLCTTDRATDNLEAHEQIQESDWKGQIRPTFRPDSLFCIDQPGWQNELQALESVTKRSISTCQDFIIALEERRAFFKRMGATATDHGVLTPLTIELPENEVESLFQKALRGQASGNDASLFSAHMLMEMARMSVEDRLVMQLHAGSFRNHNPGLFKVYGPDMGADIPIAGEFTVNLKPLLDRFGSDPRLTLILFTLDEAAYSRELAPLAGHYPAVKLGPPWWFNDSLNGMRRYFDRVMETAGIFNTVGFNDDSRAFPSIPARHDLWRRAACDWVAGLLVRHLIDEEDAQAMVYELAYGLAKKTYKFT